MALPDRGGSYKGVVTSAAITKTQKQGLPQLEFNVECHEWRSPEGRWHHVSEYGWSIRGRLILLSGKGEPNAISIEQAMEVFGWDGNSFASLEAIASKANQVPCRIYVEPKTYEGKEYMEVKSIHHPDWEPGIQGAETKDIKDWDAMFGGALRAVPKKTFVPPTNTAAAKPAISPASTSTPPALPGLPPQPAAKPKSQPDPRTPAEMAEAVKKAHATTEAAKAFARQHFMAAKENGDHDAADYWQAVSNEIDDLPF